MKHLQDIQEVALNIINKLRETSITADFLYSMYSSHKPLTILMIINDNPHLQQQVRTIAKELRNV